MKQFVREKKGKKSCKVCVKKRGRCQGHTIFETCAHAHNHNCRLQDHDKSQKLSDSSGGTAKVRVSPHANQNDVTPTAAPKTFSIHSPITTPAKPSTLQLLFSSLFFLSHHHALAGLFQRRKQR